MSNCCLRISQISQWWLFSSRHQSWPVRWTQPRLRGQRVEGVVIVLSSGLIRWSSSVKCHSASIIRISLTWPSRFHTANTRWALSQLWVRTIAERPFCLFCSELSCRGRGGGGGPLKWLHLTRSSLHKQRNQTKEDAWLPTGAKTDAWITPSHIGEAGKATVTDCGISLFVVSLHCVPRWFMIYA